MSKRIVIVELAKVPRILGLTALSGDLLFTVLAVDVANHIRRPRRGNSQNRNESEEKKTI